MGLARATLWRMRHGSSATTAMLLLAVVLMSGIIGYIAGLQAPVHNRFADSLSPVMLSDGRPMELPLQSEESLNHGSIDRSGFPSARQWGELQAKIIKLGVLYSRIARLGDLNDPEFHLDVALGPASVARQFSAGESSYDPAQRFKLANQTVTHMSNRSSVLLSMYQMRQRSESLTVSGLPVRQGKISSLYGFRIDPRSGRRQFHHGVDYSGKQGSKVLALADGVVTYSGANGGYGNLVELEHADGYRTRYAHNETNLVRVGNYVSKGQEIATMGSTGRSTGTHVHVEVRKGRDAVDPMLFIQ